tara:strand:- start:71 stop:544 length:474 start_codon:yes stop_codon:yes gene_type:complete
MKKKKIYAVMAADILHEGHINILKVAKNYGEVVVGLLTDKAVESYKKTPFLSYKQRKIVLKNIKYVKKVIPQKTLDYTSNLLKLKPDFVIHGDDWKTGVQKLTRSKVLKTLKKWGGRLIEPKYTKNISSTIIKNEILKITTSQKNKIKVKINLRKKS